MFVILNESMDFFRRNRNGFTLSELLIVVAIIALLAVGIYISYQRQTSRGFDSRRKADLNKLRTVFEDYYNDHNCYPSKEQWDVYDCTTKANGEFLKPYLQGQDIPCDPQTNERYVYIKVVQDLDPLKECRSGYRLYTELQNRTDAGIPALGCDPDPNKGCGFVPYSHNYGVSMGGPVANPAFDFGATTPTPIPPTQAGSPGDWFCMASAGPSCQEKSSCADYLRAQGCIGFAFGYCTCAPGYICTKNCL